MFFHRCGYKNSCFSELVYDFSVPVLMVYSFKDVLQDLLLDLVGTFSFEGLLYFAYNFGQSYKNLSSLFAHKLENWVKNFQRHQQKMFKSMLRQLVIIHAI